MRLSPFPFAAFVPLALAAAPAAASPPPGVTVSEVAGFHYVGPLAAPKAVHLAGSNGGITVSASADGKLDVQAVVRDGDPKRVRVITREEAGGVAICVFFADDSPDGCKVSGANRASSRNHRDEPTVDLIARVPAGVALVAGSLNGAIRARGLTAEVRVSTLNGDVEVVGGNVAEATTLNGSVDATFTAPPAGHAEITTNNGNVTVKLAGVVDAEIEASTTNGEIRTSFPMTIESTPGGYGPKSGHVRLGKGSAKIEAHSINGNVEVRGGT